MQLRAKIGMLAVGMAVAAGLVYGFMPRAVPVDLAEVKRAPLAVTVEEEGKTRVRERYLVSAPVAGYVRRITLKAGDTVYFPKASLVYVMGSVARPGPYRYQEGMTVLQALTLAGGATDRGSAGRTKVVRIVGGKKVERKVKATDLVLPEDTLVVPERFF